MCSTGKLTEKEVEKFSNAVNHYWYEFYMDEFRFGISRRIRGSKRTAATRARRIVAAAAAARKVITTVAVIILGREGLRVHAPIVRYQVQRTESFKST